MFDEFILRGYWYHDRDENTPGNKNIKEYLERVNQIKISDRIAIKQLLGQGNTKILIRAIGIVKDVDSDDHTV